MIREALNQYAATIGRQFMHDRTKTVGASEIGLCARRVHWLKHSTAEDDGYVDTLGTRGSVMESAFWYPALRMKFGEKLLYAGPEQKTFIDTPLSATPDGLLTGLNGTELKSFGVKQCSSCILVESKTIDPRVNLRTAKAENEYQVQVQLGLVRKMTAHKPTYALISYIDASFWNEVTEFVIKFDAEVYATARKRATLILLQDELPKPEGYISGGKECEYCPYAKRCGSVRRDVPNTDAPVDPQFAAEIIDMCRKLATIKDDVATLTSSVKEQQEAIKERLREKGVRNIPDVVRWSAVKARESYDYPKLRDAAERLGLDISKFETVGEATDRLQVLL